jgi:MATE family multidrug resistance protein
MSTVLSYENDDAGGPALGRRSPLAELLLLAIPTVAQMASYTAMHFVDTWMLARLGVREPTAAATGGMVVWSIIGFGVGVIVCVNTLVSQNFGQKDYATCGRYLWQGVWFSVLFAAATAPVILLAPRLFAWMGHEPELARMETTFFQITIAWTGVVLAAKSCGQFLIAVNRPWIVMLAAVGGVVATVGSNYFLIFGYGGFPKMGVAGAAWGTNIGVTVELLILATVALSGRVRAQFHSWDWRLRPRLMRVLLVIGIGSGLQLVADIAAWTVFQAWVVAQVGTAAMAANVFMFRYLSVSFMPAFGIATAVTALVGRYIGAGQPDVAERRAHLGFFVTAAYMLGCGAVYVIWRNQLMGLFTADAEVLRLGAMLLIFAGIFQLFDAMYIVYNGALRGAGDTFVPAIALFVSCWGIMVVGGYAVATHKKEWGLAGPWAMATIYGAVLGAFSLLRFARGRWRAISLDRAEGMDRLRGFEVTQPASNPS